MTNMELWQTILGELEVLVSSANFTTWFKDTGIESRTKNELSVSVPNGFTKEWLQNKYHKLILKVIQKFYPNIRDIKYIIGQPKTPFAAPDKIIISEKISSYINQQTHLNSRYNFNNFIVGKFNELAQAASLAVVKSPGKAYNPFFIYGGVGLGKTHLLQAIGNELAKTRSNKICYITSEKFTNELVEAIRHKQTQEFKNRYREVDLLLIDDIQFIGGKETTQEEFFHTFNTLYEANKQIVLSSDRPPKAIQTLEERLRSRFEGGMITDISPPDFESRLAILRNKTKEKNSAIDDNILQYIAENITNNIRELEGVLNRLIAYCQIHNTNPTLEQAAKMFSFLSPKNLHNIITPKIIIKKVSEFYSIPIKDLFKKDRRREIVKPRQIAMYLMRREINSSYPSIGQELGRRDHTTAIYACEKIQREITKNETLEQEINIIKEKLYTN